MHQHEELLIQQSSLFGIFAFCTHGHNKTLQRMGDHVNKESMQVYFGDIFSNHMLYLLFSH